MFKGLMELNCNVLVFTHFYAMSYLSPYLVMSNDIKIGYVLTGLFLLNYMYDTIIPYIG